MYGKDWDFKLESSFSCPCGQIWQDTEQAHLLESDLILLCVPIRFIDSVAYSANTSLERG